jgi:hypothetical protein
VTPPSSDRIDAARTHILLQRPWSAKGAGHVVSKTQRAPPANGDMLQRWLGEAPADEPYHDIDSIPVVRATARARAGRVSESLA